MTKNDRHKDAEIFAEILRKTKLPNEITIGKFILKGTKGVKDKIQYNQDGFESLQNEHEYTFPILDGDLQVSLQLYENTSDFYRLFCYTKINGKEGMTFSVNLTTEKELATISIYNVLGELVYNELLIPGTENTVDITYLANGCYIARISSESRNTQHKLIKN